MASGPTCASQFHSMQQMIAQGGRSGLVRLDFVITADKLALYAHEAYLMSASGVLRDMLAQDDEADPETAEPQAKVAKTSDSSDARAARLRAIIPLLDDSVTAWEEALSLLYPNTMMSAKVTWDNAERLLLLADRYDMVCITEHVKRFMSAGTPGCSRLKSCLTGDEVFRWLPVFSRCGLDEQASTCIEHIVQNSLQLPAGFLSSGVQHRHLEELYNSLQDRYQRIVDNHAERLEKIEDSLEACLQPLVGVRCRSCLTPWFKLYGSATAAARFCGSCGKNHSTHAEVAVDTSSESESDNDEDEIGLASSDIEPIPELYHDYLLGNEEGESEDDDSDEDDISDEGGDNAV